MSRSDYVIPGLHINCKHDPYVQDIFDLLKSEETRTAPVLDCFIGRTVGIIETGKGQARLWGWAKITGRIEYNSMEEFFSDSAIARHHVLPDSSYSWPASGKKYGYTLEITSRMIQPILVPSDTFTGDRTARDLANWLTGWEAVG